jgi:hypothetical protein
MLDRSAGGLFRNPDFNRELNVIVAPVNSIVMCFRFVLRKPLLLFVASSLLCALPSAALACSGPTSEAFREQNRSIVNAYGFVAIFILAAIVAVYFLRGRVGFVIVLLAALIGFFHPVWHFGQGRPDCGQQLAENAPYVTTILGGILLVQLVLWLVRRRAHPVATRT